MCLVVTVCHALYLINFAACPIHCVDLSSSIGQCHKCVAGYFLSSGSCIGRSCLLHLNLIYIFVQRVFRAISRLPPTQQLAPVAVFTLFRKRFAECMTGKYSDKAGMTTCDQCPFGSFNIANASQMASVSHFLETCCQQRVSSAFPALRILTAEMLA